MKNIYEDLKNKVAIITGGNKGIGKGCAKVFCEAGIKVVICGRDEKSGEAVANDLTHKGHVCKFYKCDVSVEQDIINLVETTVKEFGGIDYLINNAGYYPPEKPIDELATEELEGILRVNFVSQFIGCKYALPYIRKRKGSIINVSSVLAKTSQEGALSYTASKGAICAFTKSLAIDESRNGVRVNTILPGHINTELYYKNKDRAEDPNAFEDYSNHVQWAGRGGESEEIGAACLFLVSDMASFVTGIDLLVTGGYEVGEGCKHYRMDWKERMIQK